MKTRLGVLIFVFLTGMILGAMEPALLYGAETPGGNVWDFVLDTKPFTGTVLAGPLSIYYEVQSGVCNDGQPLATMYYTVRLNKKRELYTFQGRASGVCLGDFEPQGNEIRNFLETVVVPGIFPDGFNSWKFKSIGKAQFNDDNVSRAFVADIEIVVDNK